jgi:hypothetical protein
MLAWFLFSASAMSSLVFVHISKRMQEAVRTDPHYSWLIFMVLFAGLIDIYITLAAFKALAHHQDIVKQSVH